MLHRAEEDYLKNIYKLTIEKDRKLVKNNELAELLGFTDQTVNEMIKKLETKKLVKYTPYKGVSLTNKGLKEAIRLVRSHRIWEVFLYEKLNLSWKNVHAEAENLEHASSDLVVDLLYDFLGNPEYCVHGNKIPKLDGSYQKDYDLSLINAEINDEFIIKRVLDHEQLLNFLDDNNLSIGDKLFIKEKDDFNKILIISNKEKNITISYTTAQIIYGIIK